ncbi:NAD(P)H-hydrate dehydratase [Desulfitobacterium sp.]|uniref:NAD(P)H-hydrate dehydratase n=1 Tax=Desulfitobacterium sp. TaxID=49981 RepID=UPI002BF3B9FC|nr:NAD(P)H-hydrate dehydratase [Desulfitobacterium sp.]HVJ48034.1 NAD(P)H-hydrate dehydratase [Desulfitobacterium sp.]
MQVVSAQQMREIEKEAIEAYGIPSLLLMENAALAVVREIQQTLVKMNSKGSCKVIVLVGKGNNGGDGLAVARHLLISGMDVTVLSFAKTEEFRGDAALNCRLYQKAGGRFFLIEGEKQLRSTRLALNQADVIVDAIYGTGLRGALPSLVEEYVEEVNQTQAWVIAVDIPSGIEADTGKVYRSAIRAQTTVTFGLPKLGHFLGKGPEYVGRLIVDPISIPDKFLEQEEVATFVLTEDAVQAFLPVRTLQGHKGTHGKGVLVAGSPGMTGAAILAGRSALRCGIGLLQIVTPQAAAFQIDMGLTEATIWPVEGQNTLDHRAWPIITEKCQTAQALAIGPGLGQNQDFIPVLEDVLRTLELPVILDADALNLIAQEPGILGWRQRRGPLLMTPHPGEMARLCGCSVQEIEDNRLEITLNKAVEWGAILVLKGAITVIASPDGRAFLNPTGNPGLGTGGTGDVLTGSILAWLAQGVPPLEAACLGVYLHGKAADELAQDVGWSGFTATEVADQLAKTRRSLELTEKG